MFADISVPSPIYQQRHHWLYRLNRYQYFMMMVFNYLCHLIVALQWHHDEHNGVLNHRRVNCLLNRFFRCRSKKISKLRVTGLCEGNSAVTGGFPHKGPVTRKMFHLMTSLWWIYMKCKCMFMFLQRIQHAKSWLYVSSSDGCLLVCSGDGRIPTT